jgi:hypothetical protein
MNAPEKFDQAQIGLYNKFTVKRTDGTDEPGGKHEGDEYFVLNLTTDKNAIPALAAYADACNEGYPALAQDLRALIAKKISANDEYITVPECDVPGIGIVPAFTVAKYPAGRGTGDIPISTADATPWVEISYNDAERIVAAAGLLQITASQCCSIAWQIINQDENWTGGKVGEGHVFMGVHAGEVSEAVPGNYEPSGDDERTWHVLANGERIYHFAGNVFNWMRDDLHGDERGLVGADGIPATSPLLTLPTAPSMEKGMGWRPDGAARWSGYALIRGGFFGSGSNAGVFYLDYDWPGYEYDYVGFRCTKQLG